VLRACRRPLTLLGEMKTMNAQVSTRSTVRSVTENLNPDKTKNAPVQKSRMPFMDISNSAQQRPSVQATKKSALQQQAQSNRNVQQKSSQSILPLQAVQLQKSKITKQVEEMMPEKEAEGMIFDSLLCFCSFSFLTRKSL
jgi:hypothetical protein